MATQNPDPRKHEIRYGGRRFQMEYVFPAEIAVLRAHKSGLFQELPVLEWVKSLGLHGIYVDAGAHIGNHSLFFHTFCPSTHVVSIEAHPEIFKLLERNVDRNKTSDVKPWYLHNCAAWDSETEVFIGAIPRNNAGHTKITNRGGTKIPARRIDMIAPDGKVVVLKIDVEDVEEQALEGARAMIDEDHPVVIAERHTAPQLAFADRFLSDYGYKRAQEWAGIHTYAWTCR